MISGLEPIKLRLMVAKSQKLLGAPEFAHVLLKQALGFKSANANRADPLLSQLQVRVLVDRLVAALRFL